MSLNIQLSERFPQRFVKEMEIIWYLLRCAVEDERDFKRRCLKLVSTGQLEEVICFQYQRLMRYGGKWHLEKRTLLPGCICLIGAELEILKNNYKGTMEEFAVFPCEIPYVMDMCQDKNVIGISKGIIKNGRLVITSGPLRDREDMVRKIDRHKRTARIEIPFIGNRREVTVGLEIYEKL